MHQQFTVLIERDLESGWLVGSVAELPGCYTQAPDLASLERNMREAIQVFLATVGEEEQGCYQDMGLTVECHSQSSCHADPQR